MSPRVISLCDAVCEKGLIGSMEGCSRSRLSESLDTFPPKILGTVPPSTKTVLQPMAESSVDWLVLDRLGKFDGYILSVTTTSNTLHFIKYTIYLSVT